MFHNQITSAGGHRLMLIIIILIIIVIIITIIIISGDSPGGHRLMLTIYASCHLLAMTSVCTNPIMYGFLNENFKQVELD